MSISEASGYPADPYSTYLASSCFELLLIELVPMAQRIASELAAREEEWAGGAQDKAGGARKGDSTVDDEEMKEAVFYRLEMLGYRVGLGIAERFSRDRPRFNDSLDVIKFICKDVWMIVFRKQIDNLKTNHRGIYVLTDNRFTPLIRVSPSREQMGNLALVQPFLYFPAGIIRGALASMGINATVQAETNSLPGATFQIRTLGAKP